MPKEIIRNANDRESFRLVVGWEREAGHVQVGIEAVEQADGQHHLIDQIYGDGTAAIGVLFLEALQRFGRDITDDGPSALAATDAAVEMTPDLLGRLILDAVTGSTPYGSSVWVSPDRGMLNHLIRLARRARDAAFGKDE